jgi:hypothetical protein
MCIKPSLARIENQMEVNFTVMNRLGIQLHKFALFAGACGCNSYTAVILYGFNFRNFVAVCAEDFENPSLLHKTSGIFEENVQF